MRRQSPPEQPLSPRLLGRSLPYTAANLPERLRRWHAPRINRWERLEVLAGPVAVESLDVGGVVRVTFEAGSACWFKPGSRWRVGGLGAAASFALETHATARGQADAPQASRAELLTAAPLVELADAAAMTRWLRELPSSAPALVEARFAWDEAAVREWTSARTLFWHPLERSANGFSVLVVRAADVFDLPDYLGRDHTAIEAALGCALADHPRGKAWLDGALARHLEIEEQVLFPAWLAAGGPDELVAGLLREHGFLREYLHTLDERLSRRRFLRLLDGHDEKEERAVYADLAAQPGVDARALLARALTWPLATPAWEPGR